MDKTTTVYPRKGRSVITGVEYSVARSLGCKLTVLGGFTIPWKGKDGANIATRPFATVIKELQRMRKLYPKHSALERIYKDLGNMLYGGVVTGLSDKYKYDNRSKTMKRMEGGTLSSPILGSWITGFVRSLISELMNNVPKLGGTVVSVTTDGFITDVESLESKILEGLKTNQHLLGIYRNARFELTRQLVEDKETGETIIKYDSSALELKTSVKGIIS